MVGYTYDAWGNCTIDSSTTNYDIAHDNPIRYRGYYYDEDTGLYYLNSRYYNPEWRRFISPDDAAYLDSETPNGLNLYCYCNNDPVNYADPSGHSLLLILGLIGSLGVAALFVAAGVVWVVAEVLGAALKGIIKFFKAFTDPEVASTTVESISEVVDGINKNISPVNNGSTKNYGALSGSGGGGGLFDPILYKILNESFTGSFQ